MGAADDVYGDTRVCRDAAQIVQGYRRDVSVSFERSRQCSGLFSISLYLNPTFQKRFRCDFAVARTILGIRNVSCNTDFHRPL